MIGFPSGPLMSTIGEIKTCSFFILAIISNSDGWGLTKKAKSPFGRDSLFIIEDGISEIVHDNFIKNCMILIF